MTAHAWALLGVFAVLLLVLAWPLARWIDAVMDGRIGWAARVEAPLLRAVGLPAEEAEREMGWLHYTLGLLVINGLGLVALYALQRLQDALPLNPQTLANVTPDSRLRHGGQFRDQHQLAGLRRRIDDELLHSDDRARRCRIFFPRPPGWRWPSR